jgi:hypothetical protein
MLYVLIISCSWCCCCCFNGFQVDGVRGMQNKYGTRTCTSTSTTGSTGEDKAVLEKHLHTYTWYLVAFSTAKKYCVPERYTTMRSIYIKLIGQKMILGSIKCYQIRIFLVLLTVCRLKGYFILVRFLPIPCSQYWIMLLE